MFSTWLWITPWFVVILLRLCVLGIFPPAPSLLPTLSRGLTLCVLHTLFMTITTLAIIYTFAFGIGCVIGFTTD